MPTLAEDIRDVLAAKGLIKATASLPDGHVIWWVDRKGYYIFSRKSNHVHSSGTLTFEQARDEFIETIQESLHHE